jgi:hypothetical protein
MRKLIALSIAGLVLMAAAPTFAAGDISVVTNNNAEITNDVSSHSSTGYNTASGSEASLHVTGATLKEVGGANDVGTGGNKVLGGSGGVIQTGSAQSLSEVTNRVNISKTNVEATSWAVDKIFVGTDNNLELLNNVNAKALSGMNQAGASSAVANIIGANLNQVGGANNGGAGGNVVDGGNNGGSAIVTGDSASQSSVLNVVNRTISRIKK